MKALILNSGLGTRMGGLTAEHPKCMTDISSTETIISRQLRQLVDFGIHEVVITTGLFDGVLEEYCRGLDLPLEIRFVKNERYRETNYIFSIYQAREYLTGTDILLMHGDLVFENRVLDRVLGHEGSCMAVSSTAEIPQKDFKAVIKDGKIISVGIEFFDHVMAAQPLYHLSSEDWAAWLENICNFCERGEVHCYAENALNEIAGKCNIRPLDVAEMLCNEIDDPADLENVSERLRQVEQKIVYMAFSVDVLHSGHIRMIRRAARLGRLIIGLLTDEVIAGYKQIPWLPIEERKAMFGAFAGVYRVVEQNSLSYRENLEKYRPDYVVHGDDWREGVQKDVRNEVIELLKGWDGELIEYPHASAARYKRIEQGPVHSQHLLHSMEGQPELEEYLKGCSPSKILLVCGENVRGFKLESIFDEVRERLGIDEVVFSSFKPNPDFTSVVEGIRVYQNEGCDMIVAVGGGSAMDVAKCIKLYADADPDTDLLKKEIVPNTIPFLAVPTTAGSGSEATRYAVIYKNGEKQSITHTSCIPAAVLNAPELLRTIPDYQRKSTMLDALCHAVESMWSVHSNEESREYAREALRLIYENREAYLDNEEGGNRNMLYAANLAGKAINITQTTAGHAMSYKLTTNYGLAHGHAAALCTAAVWKHMREHIKDVLDPRGEEYLAGVLDELESRIGVEDFADMLKQLRMERPKLGDIKELELLASTVNVTRLANHPVRLNKEDIFELYRKICII